MRGEFGGAAGRSSCKDIVLLAMERLLALEAVLLVVQEKGVIDAGDS